MLLGTALNASACGKIHERNGHSRTMADEPFDSAWALLKREEPFGPASPSRRPHGPISPEDLRRLQLQALRRMQVMQANAEARKRLQAQQDPKISNYMADSAESMAQNNPTANLAHPSGNLPGVPPLYTEPLDLSMESLRENQE